MPGEANCLDIRKSIESRAVTGLSEQQTFARAGPVYKIPQKNNRLSTFFGIIPELVGTRHNPQNRYCELEARFYKRGVGDCGISVKAQLLPR